MTKNELGGITVYDHTSLASDYVSAFDSYGRQIAGMTFRRSNIEEGINENNKKEIVTDINIIVPEKVVEVTFGDNKKEKMVCHEADKFDLERCLYIAIAKHLYKKDYTFDGIEHKANELMYIKKYVKIVNKALKNHKEKIKKEENEKRILQEEKLRNEKNKAKYKAYKERKAAKRKADEKEFHIEIQKEAIIRAMDAIKEKENM